MIPQFNQLVALYGEEEIEFEVAKMVLSLKNFYNVGNNMSAEQCKETARLILQQYWYFRPTELRIFFDNCKVGKYTKGDTLFNRFDGLILFEWLKVFCVERDEAIKRNREKEESYKRSIQPITAKEVDESYNKLRSTSSSKEAKSINEFMGIPSIGEQLSKFEKTLNKTKPNEDTK